MLIRSMGPISEEDMVSTIMVYEYRISLDNDVLSFNSTDYTCAFISYRTTRWIATLDNIGMTKG